MDFQSLHTTMNLKTLDKSNAVHVLNIMSMVMAWGVTSYFFDSMVPNNPVEKIGTLLMLPLYFTDMVLSFFSNYSVLGNFNLMFFILWFFYALPITIYYPILMVKNHEETDLKDWYISKGSQAG